MTEKDNPLDTLPASVLSTLPTMMQPGALMEQLVGMILKKSRPQLAQAIRLCAVPFGFDLALLAALRQGDDGLDEKILARMARFSFVHQDDRGRYTFSHEVRAYLLDEWLNDRPGFVEANRRVQAHFLGALRETFPDRDAVDALAQAALPARLRPLVEAPPEVNELVQNYLHHTLVAEPEMGLVLLRRLYRAAAEAQRPALAERFVDIANEQRAWLKPGQRAYVDYMRGLLDQLQGKWDASRALFERMLQHEGLPPTLQARIRRALGNTLIEQEQWVEAMALFEAALQAFQAAGDELESAFTMVNMGRAHLDLALNTWGGGATFSLGRRWADRMRDLLMFGRRLPFIIYLVSRLGVRTLPVPLRVGRDMDWPIARLLAIAADWLDRAGVILRRLGDEDGMGQVEENLAQLYLSLGHFRRAKALYQRMLAPEGASLSEYRAARARLGLAQALVYQGQLTQARELLGQILPVFVAYQHPLRIAQTHTALAQTYALERQTAQAATHYQQAIQLYHQLDDEGNTTEVVEQMLLLRERPQADETTRQSIETTASQITHRRYLTRFNLPALNWFRMVALGSLAAVFLFSLLIFVRIESGTGLYMSEVSLSRHTDVTALFIEPVIPIPEFTPQLESSFEVNSSALLIVVAVVVYLVFYTVYGLWITVRTPLRTLQEGQRLDIVVTPYGLSRGVEGLPGSSKIKWEQVSALLSSDRSLFRKPTSVFFSRFTLVGKTGAIVVDGRTRRYLALRDFVQQRLSQSTRPDEQPVATFRFGFSLFYSHSGRLLVVTLAFILACIVTALLAPQTLATRLGPLPYSLADLYSISYLGLSFPACWWLAVQPLRERLLLRPDTRAVWLVGLVGLLLIVIGFTVMDWLRSLHLPNVAAGMELAGAFLTGVAAYYVWRARCWERMPWRQGERVYAPAVRLAVFVAALALIALTLGFVGRAAGARHYLTLANVNWQRAADVHAAEDHARAQDLYEEALSLYDRALDWGDDTASTQHSRGAVLIQLGRYAEAIEPLQKAVAKGPAKTIYYNSLAIAYSKQARVYQESGDDEEGARQYYELARDNYGLVLKRMRKDSAGLVNVYLSRAGESSQIGAYYYGSKDVEGHWGLAQENYEAAHADYTRALELEPDNVAALSGRGWTAYKLSQFETAPGQKRNRLTYALGDLERATLVDPHQLFAWLGMGYTHFAIGETLTWQDEETGDIKSPCVDSPHNPSTYEQKLAYKEENLKAIEALERVAALAPENASLSTMQGRIYYNLLNCPDMGAEQMYMAAIKLGPTLAVWPWGLAEYYRVQGELDKAIPYYVRAVELEPTNYRWQANLGWWAYVNGDYQISVEASQAAVALNSAEPIPIFNRGLALVAMGDAESAWQVYQDGIVATDVLTDTQAALYRYDMARDDLEHAAQDPAGIADALRAHLTFKEALVYLKAGAADEAGLAYQTGLAIAATLNTPELRRSLYDQAIDDLRAVSLAEWRAVVAALIAQLEAARGE